MALAAFSPVPALVGGALIGVAAVLLLAVNGRVMGISGVVGGLLGKTACAERGWRVAFLLGLAVAGVVGALWLGGLAAPADTPVPLLLAAGFLVGFGTRMGNGCTSGHGICGLARLSPRSLAAVVVFMTSAAATVFVVRHVMGGM